jgi:hypothetical protein
VTNKERRARVLAAQRVADALEGVSHAFIRNFFEGVSLGLDGFARDGVAGWWSAVRSTLTNPPEIR